MPLRAIALSDLETIGDYTMTLTPILIEAPTIASAWCKIIQAIHTLGEVHNPDYGTPTQRVHLTVKISDVHNRQASELLPFGSKSIEKYKEELTEDCEGINMNLSHFVIHCRFFGKCPHAQNNLTCLVGGDYCGTYRHLKGRPR